MEPPKAEVTQDFSGRVRFKLALTKCRVIKVTKDLTGHHMVLDFPGNKLIITLPPHSDVVEGDICTIYTEVFAHAHPQSTSVQ